MEVDQQSRALVCQFHVNQQARFVAPFDLVNRLQFHAQSVFDQHINPIAAIKVDPILFNGKRHLKLKGDMRHGKLACQALLVRRFQQARAQGA
jgi:hypothetical protein